ncbi:MAG: hypothetical protein IJB02_02890 [Oscillospiraceae bacterium]|nr:hypothetical protein [Oscillospiraceae bacterium]
MKLPVGLYAVSADFKDRTGTALFSFQDTEYAVQIGENAFENLDALVKYPLEPVKEPFLGYGDRPVILVGAGVLPMGNGATNQEKFRTNFPCAVAILGENAGISPNAGDLRTPAKRRPESVLLGSFYFGAVAMSGEVSGTLTVDGVCLKAKIQDYRTGGQNAVLEVKNTLIESELVYTLLHVTNFAGSRKTVIQNCRADGLEDRDGEGNLFRFDCGENLVENLYVANTRKFLGMTNYACTGINRIASLTLKNCLFENSRSVHGLTVNLPEDSTACVTLEGCGFHSFTPREDPAVTAVLPQGAILRVKDCCFTGDHTAPAILVDGSMDGVRLENTAQTGYRQLCMKKAPRRTTVEPDRIYPIEDPHTLLENADFGALDRLYAGRQIFYGDFHCHSNSGGTSDGKTPIENYVADMQKLHMDFAAIVDHKQMRHFFLPCWDEKYLICGTEPATVFTDVEKPGYAKKFDYTMIFPDKTGLMRVLEKFPGFGFAGTPEEGAFQYYFMPKTTFLELAAFVYSIGGLVSHAHPKQMLSSPDPLDYYFGDLVPLETVHVAPDNYATRQNRDLWVALLKLGKRVKTHGSSDAHGPVSNRGLTAVYAERHYSTDIFRVIRKGDCTAGGVAIQMSIDGAVMGTVAEYAPGKTLYIRVEDFHIAHRKEATVFCLKVYTDQGLAYAREFDCCQKQALAIPVKNRKYYRVEITNESDGCPVAFSNPVWLEEQNES